MAQNLYQGFGFSLGHPLPVNTLVHSTLSPGYSLLIFIGMNFGLNSVFAAKWISLLAFGFLLIVVFSTGEEIENVYVGYVSALVLLSMNVMWIISRFIWTEMPYLLFIMMGFYFICRYFTSNKIVFLTVGGLCLGCAVLIRPVGICAIAAAGLTLLIFDKSQLGIRVRSGILLLGSSFFIIGPWVFYNKMVAGSYTFYDTYARFDMANFMYHFYPLCKSITDDLTPVFIGDFLQKLNNLLPKEFVYCLQSIHGFSILSGLGILLLIIPGIVLVYLLTVRKIKINPGVFALYLYPLLYCGLILFFYSYTDIATFYYRFNSVFYPSIILVFVSVIFIGISQIHSKKRDHIKYLLFAVFLIFFSGHVVNSLNSIAWSHGGNGYSSTIWNTDRHYDKILSNYSGEHIYDLADGHAFQFFLYNKSIYNIEIQGIKSQDDVTRIPSTPAYLIDYKSKQIRDEYYPAKVNASDVIIEITNLCNYEDATCKFEKRYDSDTSTVYFYSV